ncbi:MAG: carbamoyltransferase family protein [Candidatus Binatia bacterium]
MTLILGISAFYHDSAAAIVRDGEIVAAAQEERFSRRKHDEGFPAGAVDYCLRAAGCSIADLDYVGFYEKPLAKFDRLMRTYLAFAPSGYSSLKKALPQWLQTKLRIPRELDRGLRGEYAGSYTYADHHESHAASAFYPSPFEEAAILTLDGVGEWSTASFGAGRGHRIELSHELRFPHSLGLLYSAFTYYTGFKVNSAEYKVMGLAPYGKPRFLDAILEHLVDLRDDGSFRMNMRYFNYCQGLTMTSPEFDALFGGPPRSPDAPLTEREMDLAASVQAVTDEIMMRAARHLHRTTGMSRLAISGGVGLNCVSTGKLLREGPFEDVWVQPASGDAGGALGIALLIWHQLLENPRHARAGDGQSGSLLGPEYSDVEIQSFLDGAGIPYREFASTAELCEVVAGCLAGGEVIGWFQGRMEFGPRALGCRSILADARDPEMQSRLNRKIKYREGFRPFAPAVLEEHCAEYFVHDRPGPYMTFVAPLQEAQLRPLSVEERQASGLERLKIARSSIPAVTHVDGSARIQTVGDNANPRFRELLRAFHRQTGCPLIVNTSFNVRGEPIVRTPEEAFACFLRTDIDRLAIGSFLLEQRAKHAVELGNRRTLEQDWGALAPARPVNLHVLDD